MMQIPARYLTLQAEGRPLLRDLADENGLAKLWEVSMGFPPGFVAIPLYEVGNDDLCGFYWPWGREDEAPLLCDLFHESSTLEPVAASLEGLLQLKTLDGWYVPEEDEEDDEDALYDWRLIHSLAEQLDIVLPAPQLEPPTSAEARLRLVPDAPSSLLVAGKEAMNANRDEDAERHLRAAIKLLPEYTAALFALAMLLRRQNRRIEAAQTMIEVICAPLCFGSGRKQCLEWVQRWQGEEFQELETDPLWKRRHELTFQTGVKSNADFEIYEEAVEEYLKQRQGIRAVRLRVLIGELMAGETSAFRDRYNYSIERHIELLKDATRRAGLNSRVAE